MNPTGLVPTLQEDHFTLWESNAILRYLAQAHAPDSSVLARRAARARQCRSLDGCAADGAQPADAVVFWGLVRTPPDKRDAAAIQAAITDTARIWGMVSAQLARHPYLAGDDLTLADIPWVRTCIAGSPCRLTGLTCRICARGMIACWNGNPIATIWLDQSCRPDRYTTQPQRVSERPNDHHHHDDDHQHRRHLVGDAIEPLRPRVAVFQEVAPPPRQRTMESR